MLLARPKAGFSKNLLLSFLFVNILEQQLQETGGGFVKKMIKKTLSPQFQKIKNNGG